MITAAVNVGAQIVFFKKHLNFLKSDREREIVYDIPYRQNPERNDTNELN